MVICGKMEGGRMGWVGRSSGGWFSSGGFLSSLLCLWPAPQGRVS